MSSKHTPGPWTVLPEEMGKSYLRVRGTVLGLRYKIADVRHISYDNAPASEAQTTHANARLIAAAPELLEALQRLDKNGHTQATWEFALRAIAKATGESA